MLQTCASNYIILLKFTCKTNAIVKSPPKCLLFVIKLDSAVVSHKAKMKQYLHAQLLVSYLQVATNAMKFASIVTWLS